MRNPVSEKELNQIVYPIHILAHEVIHVTALCHSLSLHELDETIKPNAADFQVLLHGILRSVFVLLQRPLALFRPQYL